MVRPRRGPRTWWHWSRAAGLHYRNVVPRDNHPIGDDPVRGGAPQHWVERSRRAGSSRGCSRPGRGVSRIDIGRPWPSTASAAGVHARSSTSRSARAGPATGRRCEASTGSRRSPAGDRATAGPVCRPVAAAARSAPMDNDTLSPQILASLHHPDQHRHRPTRRRRHRLAPHRVTHPRLPRCPSSHGPPQAPADQTRIPDVPQAPHQQQPDHPQADHDAAPVLGVDSPLGCGSLHRDRECAVGRASWSNGCLWGDLSPLATGVQFALLAHLARGSGR